MKTGEEEGNLFRIGLFEFVVKREQRLDRGLPESMQSLDDFVGNIVRVQPYCLDEEGDSLDGLERMEELGVDPSTWTTRMRG